MKTRASLKGWEENVDEESGKKYYYNPSNERSSWTHPKTKENEPTVIQKEIVKLEKKEDKPERAAKYKPVSDYAVAKHLQIAPLARILSKYSQIICLLCGLLTIFLPQHFTGVYPTYVGVGIYTTLIPIVIGIINCMSQFDKGKFHIF